MGNRNGWYDMISYLWNCDWGLGWDGDDGVRDMNMSFHRVCTPDVIRLSGG